MTSDDRSALRVAVDALPLIGERTGVGHTTGHLVEQLADRSDVDLVLYAVSRIGPQALAEAIPANARLGASRFPARVVHALWARLDRPRVERWTKDVDVVHATNYVAPPATAPVIVTVHDLSFARYPELCQPVTRRYDAQVRRALARGATIHAVSDFVASEIREHYDVGPERVERVYFGVAPADGGEPESGHRMVGFDRYVLALGTLEPRKNLPRLVAAFDRVAAHDQRIRLVIAGPDGWDMHGLERELGNARHGDRVVRLGYVEDARRRDLLAGATTLAYPSLYEGFGHPPLEAMGAGVPVVAATSGALPEVLGDAAILVDPTDVTAIADAVVSTLDDDGLRSTLVARGRERVTRYPWDRAADEFVALYRSVAANVASSSRETRR